MLKLIILKFSVALLLLGCLGCAHMNIDASNSESSILMGAGNGSTDYRRLGDFNIIKQGGWLFWGLTITGHPDVGKLIDNEVLKKGGNGVIYLEIKSTRTFMDGFLMVITLGIYTRRTLEISGTVVMHSSNEESMSGD